MKTMILENGSKKKCHLRTARKVRVDCVQNPQVKDKVQNTECHFSPAEMGLNVVQTSGFLNAFAFKMTSKQKMIFSFLRLLLIQLDQVI